MKVDRCVLINLSEEELQSVCDTVEYMRDLLKVIEQEPDLNARFELVRGNGDVEDLISICAQLAEYI